MRKLLPFLAFILLAACNGKPESEEVTEVVEPSNILKNLAYSIDTILVDSGDKLINLKSLSSFDKRHFLSLSPDDSLLYFFDRHRLVLQEINLNSLKLINDYPFEAEGPNGIGRMVYTFKSLPNGYFYGRDLRGEAWILSKTGKKISTLKLNGEELLQDTNLEPFSIANELTVDSKRKKLYSLPHYHSSGDIYFAKMDSVGQSGEIAELSELAKISEFEIVYNGEGGDGRREQVYLQQLNDLVLISSTVGNDIYIYDPHRDSLFFKSFLHELVPLAKDVKVKNEVFSRAESQTEADKLHTQIDYWDFYWDKKTQSYYRFASKGLPLPNIDSPKKYEYFMFAYNKDLSLKGETKMEGLSELPIRGFFKDGKLYSYVNVDDELGFAVFTFNF